MKKSEENTILAWVASFFIIIGFLVGYLSKKENKYVMHYAKEGLVLFIFFVIASFFSMIPFIGWVLYLFVVILWIFSWVNALSGEKRETLIISDLAKKINIK